MKKLPFEESNTKINWFSHIRPTHECPICKLPYWIERTCDGTFDHTTGKRLPHEVVMVVSII